MKPVHVPGLVVQGHVVVESGIHAAHPQPEGYGQKTQEKEAGGVGESQQGQGGKEHTEGRDGSYPKPLDEPGAKEARDDGPPGYDHGNNARKMNGYREAQVHAGPGRPQQRIG